MRKISKKALALLLAVIMATSVFAIVPFTVYAESGETQSLSGYNITALTTVTADNVQPGKNPDLLYDGKQDGVYNKNGDGAWDINVKLPEGFTPTGVKVLFEHDTEGSNLYLQRSIDVAVNTSTDGSTYTQNPAENATYMGGATKVIEDGTGVTDIKISLSNPNPSTLWVGIAELQVFAVPNAPQNADGIENLTVKALYKSQKLEWESTGETAGNYTVSRKPFGAEGEYSDLSGSVTSVTVDGKTYYTYLDEVGENSTENYVYKIKNTSSNAESEVIAVEDCSVSALKRNALVAVNYGPFGKEFSTSGETVATAESEKVLFAKLQALQYGTIGAMAKTTDSTTTKKSVVTLGTSDGAFLSFNDSGALNKFRVQLPTNGFKIAPTVANVNDGGIHSVYACIDSAGWHFNYDNGSSSGDNANTTFAPFMDSTIDTIVVGGAGSNAETSPFIGTIYDVVVTEETFESSGLAELSQNVYSSVELADAVTEGRELLRQYGASFTEDSKAVFESALTASEKALEGVVSGATTEAECDILLSALEAAQEQLDYDYYTVKVCAGTGAADVTLSYSENDNGDVVGSTDKSVSFRYGNAHDITVTASAAVEGLTFDGWYENGSSEAVSVQESYTVSVDDGKVLTAKYKGFNGVPEEGTVELVTERDALIANATANSARAENGTDGTVVDSSPAGAFDGDVGVMWHQNWGNGGFGANDTAPTPEAPVWIQSGFDVSETEEVESKLIGAIGYVPKASSSSRDMTNGEIRVDNCIYEYEIYIADDANFTDPVLIAEGSFNYADEMKGQEQMVYFDAPYDVKFIRICANSASYGNSPGVCAREINLYEFVGAEPTTGVDLELDGEVVDTLTVSKGENVLLEKDVESEWEVTEEQLNAALANVDLEEMFGGTLNTIKENYTVDVSTFDPAARTCEIKSEPAVYTVTANINGENVKAVAEYGNPLYVEGTNEYITAPDGDEGTFAYWTNAEGEIIATSQEFNFVATDNITITAVYGETTGFGAYIPAPVISKTADGKWKVEVPVTLINAMTNSDDESGYTLRGEVTDYGIAIANVSAEDDTVKAAIGGTESADVSVLSAYKAVAEENRITPTNKGRYLHTVTAESITNAKIIAYIVVAGEDGSETVYISAARTVNLQ